MKQKRVMVLVLTLFIISLIGISYAAEINESDIEKGYTCLKAATDANNCATNDVKLNAFNLLALAYNSDSQAKCKTSLLSKKSTSNCWPAIAGGSCDIKATSIAMLALNRIGEDNSDIINWTLTKRRLETSLVWYLEIDAINYTQCTVNGKVVNLGDDKKLITPSGNPEGLEKTYGNYWFKISDIQKNFTISCNKTFTTTLMYQKPSENIYYVSSNPHTASGGDSTSEKVNSYCFGPTLSCDYESSLWATLALSKEGLDISSYLPYLSAMSDSPDNLRYLPSSFLLMLTEMGEYEQQLKSYQKDGKYWGESSNPLELTPLGLAALSGRDIPEVKDSQKYILSLQDKNSGCWGNDKTSYILYLIWPKAAIAGPVTPDRNGTQIITCEDRTYSCVASTRCLPEDQESYECNGFAEVCCSKPIAEQSCSDQGGIECDQGKTCSEDVVETSDIRECCLSKNCVEQGPTPDPCPSSSGYTCKNKCSAEEKYYSSYTCTGNVQCCYKETATDEKSNLWLIILLIILIILVFLAIIFRNQLQVWWFRIKNGVSSKKGPGPTTRPIVTPPFRPVPQRPMVPRQENRPFSRPSLRPNEKDKEFEDTMKKLRDMSK